MRTFECDRRFRDYLEEEDDPGLAVVRLIDGMSDKLLFTVVTDAALNARGVRLSATARGLEPGRTLDVPFTNGSAGTPSM